MRIVLGLGPSAHTSALFYLCLGRLNMTHFLILGLKGWNSTLFLWWLLHCRRGKDLLKNWLLRMGFLRWGTAEHMNWIPIPGRLRVYHLWKNISGCGHLGSSLGPTPRASSFPVAFRSTSLYCYWLLVYRVVLVAIWYVNLLIVPCGPAHLQLLFLGVTKDPHGRVGPLEYSLSHHS